MWRQAVSSTRPKVSTNPHSLLRWLYLPWSWGLLSGPKDASVGLQLPVSACALAYIPYEHIGKVL
jgi:hypothetical protein